MDITIGFIGAGNMGRAMIEGIVASEKVTAHNIYVFDMNQHSLQALKTEHGVGICDSTQALVQTCDWIILAVKPQVYPVVLESVKKHWKSSKILISIAAGISIAQMESILGHNQKIVRTMPNTPALIGEAMSAVCANNHVSKNEVEKVLSLFQCFGKAEVVYESLIDAVIGVSGSAPAYVFMLIEAMADAAVWGGMPRNKAYTFAAQAVQGAAKMVLETGKHPGELKDMVCSPAGTTIEAVRTLEKHGFRTAVFEGIADCIKKSKMMSSN